MKGKEDEPARRMREEEDGTDKPVTGVSTPISLTGLINDDISAFSVVSENQSCEFWSWSPFNMRTIQYPNSLCRWAVAWSHARYDAPDDLLMSIPATRYPESNSIRAAYLDNNKACLGEQHFSQIA